MITDSLCHLDKKFGNAAKSAQFLASEAAPLGIGRIFLCNLPGKQFDGSEGYLNQEVMEAVKDNTLFCFFPGINPLESAAKKEIGKMKEAGASGIKLHPRLHGYNIECAECVSILQYAGKLNMPAIICGFPDGINIMLENTPEAFGRVAQKCPKSKIMMAHAGGHKILDAMMVMKRCPNLYLDISFSLLYYRGSNILNDIAYAIRSCKGKRFLWGTDYPDRPYEETVLESRKILDGFHLNEEYLKMILEHNPLEFLNN